MLLVRSFYYPTEGIRLTLLSTKCIEIEDIRIFVALTLLVWSYDL